MAETSVLGWSACGFKVLEAVEMLRDLPKEVADVKDELEGFQDFINDTDKMAEAEKGNSRPERINKRLMRLREAALCMEDAFSNALETITACNNIIFILERTGSDS
ncbi:hypothetical protein VNO80_30178 [Phaseolus coccineus]|uniref:Rx N-terminal domain-containing protein n=1 Tax=Phaseolus coccineus TaxID=3886 RepID=A0AAN9QFL9_PHACN